MSAPSVQPTADNHGIEEYILRPLRDDAVIVVDVPERLVGTLRAHAFIEFVSRCDDARSCDCYQRSPIQTRTAAVLFVFIQHVGLILDQLGWLGHDEAPDDPPLDRAPDQWPPTIRAHRGVLLEVISRAVQAQDETVEHALSSFHRDDETPEEIRGHFDHISMWLEFYEQVRDVAPISEDGE